MSRRTKKEVEKIIEKVQSAKPTVDPKDAKIKRFRGIISDLCQSVDVQRGHQKHLKCFECDHFISEAYEKACKI